MSNNIGMPSGTLEYKAFEISWQDPPLMPDCFRGNVAGTTPHLLALMGRNGSQVIEGRDREDMIAKAKAYIDSLGD